VEDNHNAAVAPAAYVITVALFSVSSHLSAMVVRTSSALNFSARAIVCARRCRVREVYERAGHRSSSVTRARVVVARVRLADEENTINRAISEN